MTREPGRRRVEPRGMRRLRRGPDHRPRVATVPDTVPAPAAGSAVRRRARVRTGVVSSGNERGGGRVLQRPSSATLTPDDVAAADARDARGEPRCGLNRRWATRIPWPGPSRQGCGRAPRRRFAPGASRAGWVLAESEGFEPSKQVLPAYSLSRGAPSATRSRLRHGVDSIRTGCAVRLARRVRVRP